MFYSHITNIIGNGVALDIPKVFNEVNQLVERGVPAPHLMISDRAQVVMPYHILQDTYEEARLAGKSYGSTKSGIAPFYSDKFAKIDQEMYEAADLDGANARQKMWYITLPMLIPMVVVMVLMGLGNIMHSDTGLFYQVTKNSGALYSTTQVLDSYVFNAVMTASNYSTTAATTLYQSVIDPCPIWLYAGGRSGKRCRR